MTPILRRENRWVCPNCDATDVTYEARPHTRLHRCRGMAGLEVPMVPDGVRCKVETHEREDYEGDDHGWVRLDGEGRPIMNAKVTRDHGEDLVVYAPTAHMHMEEIQ